AAVVGFLVATNGAEVLLGVPADVLAAAAGANHDVLVAAWKAKKLGKLSVPMGIISGLLAGMLYIRYSNIQLPSYLAFFAGRRETGGLLMSMGLPSLLTGVTEPIEFTFMFLAPALYVIHALLTGTEMVVMHMLGVRLGFSFSAGLFDYLLNFKYASHPLYLL